MREHPSIDGIGALGDTFYLFQLGLINRHSISCRSEGRRGGGWVVVYQPIISLPGHLGLLCPTARGHTSFHTALSTLDWSCWAPLITSASCSFILKVVMSPHCSLPTPLQINPLLSTLYLPSWMCYLSSICMVTKTWSINRESNNFPRATSRKIQ